MALVNTPWQRSRSEDGEQRLYFGSMPDYSARTFLPADLSLPILVNPQHPAPSSTNVPIWLSYLVSILEERPRVRLQSKQQSAFRLNTFGIASTPASASSAPTEQKTQSSTPSSQKESLSGDFRSDDNMSPLKPHVGFRMTTRRSSRQAATSAASTVAPPPLPTKSSSPKKTPAAVVSEVSPPTSSSLSSAPSSLGSSPSGISTVRKSIRKRPLPVPQSPTIESTKRRKVATKAPIGGIDTPPFSSPQGEVSNGENVQAESTSALNFKNSGTPKTRGSPRSRGGARSSRGSKPQISISEDPESEPSPVVEHVRGSGKKYVGSIYTRSYTNMNSFPEYHAAYPTFFSADTETSFQHGSQDAPSSTSSPKKPARGGGVGRGRGGGRGRGRGRGRGGRGDTPEPHRKRVLTEDDRLSLAALKARQQDLKRFFSIVGTHQLDVLDIISSKDMSKMVKKAKAHKQVSEYDELVAELQARRKGAEREAQTRYKFDYALAMADFEAAKYVIQSKYKTRVDETQKEYGRGVEGDMLLLHQKIVAENDDTHTLPDSGTPEPDRFPQYNQLPEPNVIGLRGYNSKFLPSEVPFQAYLTHVNKVGTGTGLSDLAAREVVDAEIITPLLKALEENNKMYKEVEERKKTQNIITLTEEATKQLKEINGYLIPKPMPIDGPENTAFALSALADVSELVAQRHPQRQYIFMPMAPGEHFPVEALQLGQLPGVPPAPPTIASAHATAAAAPLSRRLPPQVMPPPPIPRQLPPPPPPSAPPATKPALPQQQHQQRFIFQQPQLSYPPQQHHHHHHHHNHHHHQQPPPLPSPTSPTQNNSFRLSASTNASANGTAGSPPMLLPPPPPRIPITFVDQTGRTKRKNSTKGQRVLLPKM